MVYGLFVDIECAKSYAKMAESAKTLASQQVSRYPCQPPCHLIWLLRLRC